MPWTAHIDGGSRGNPGPAAAGVVITDPQGKTVFAGGFHLGRATNNHAEYQGLLHALTQLERAEADDIEIVSDSQLMVRQINGEYRVKSPQLKPLYEQAVSQLAGFQRWTIRHVLRHLNTAADGMANDSMDRGIDTIDIDLLGVATEQPKEKPAPRVKKTATIVAMVMQVPASDDCPVAMTPHQRFKFSEIMPEGLCVNACSAMMQTVMEMRKDHNAGPVTVRCPNEDCGAEFRLERA